jgi:hypothetical protein
MHLKQVMIVEYGMPSCCNDQFQLSWVFNLFFARKIVSARFFKVSPILQVYI